jgi:cell division protein FtsA
VKNIYTSVDIGSDTIKIVVCELFRNKLNLLAASSVKSRGIKKGVVTDINEATISLKQAFNEIELMLGIKINKVIASVPSYFADFVFTKGETKVNHEDGIIGGSDVIKVLQVAMQSKMTPNKEMVTMIPIDFSIDNQDGIKDPKGLVGSVLETRAIMVTTPKKNIYSVVGLIESIGIEVVDISLNCIGDAYAFKNKAMDEHIGAIVNIGSETTSVSLYNKGIIVKNSIIQLGGKNIDNDIAYIYKIEPSVAVKIKEKFALAHKRYASVNDTYEITTPYDETIKINQFEVSEIVMSRIEEILNLAKKEINILTNKKIQYIIVTGGTSNMAHFNYIAEEVFGKEVIIGNVKLVGIRNNKYSSALGNVVYFINKLKLKGKEYSMFSKNDVEELSSTKKNLINVSNESMLGKVFGYFWSE